MANTEPAFPVTLQVDLPDRALNRVTTLFRVFMIVPIAIVLCLLNGPAWSWQWQRSSIWEPWSVGLAAGGILFAPTLLMLLFRQKYPRWWFDWNVNLWRFMLRLQAYAMLLTDVYPSTDEQQAVHLKVPYPDAKKDLSPWMPLVKWFLAIPHYVLLVFLGFAAVVTVVISWFAILFTGRYPKELARFVVGVMRWSVRVGAYAFLLVTDVYPPFTLD